MKKHISAFIFAGALIGLTFLGGSAFGSVRMAQAAESTVQTDLSSASFAASLSATEVKVGDTVKVKSKQKNLTYKSSDTSVAYVDANGVITGKKAGTVTITVKKSSGASVKLKLKVVKKKYKPEIKVVYDEISLTDTCVADGVYQFRVVNHSKNKIKKIVFYYQAQVVTGQTETTDPVTGKTTTTPVISGQQLKITTGAIAAGSTSGVYSCQAPASGFASDMELTKVLIYAGNSKVTYNAAKKTSSYGWGTKDTKAPVISGLVGTDSYNGSDVFITLYKDLDFDFSKYITAEDDRDKNVKISVDTDQINWDQPGIYNLTVTATDKAGNQAKETVRVKVKKKSELESIADEVLDDIIKDSWSDTKKVRAIYSYVKSHISYTNSSKYSDWEKEAVFAFRYGYGDCLAYYSCCRALFNRCGIPSLKIQRNTTNPTHYWNMVYLKNGWYHVDACRRQISCYLCLLTDAQLHAFSNYYYSLTGFYPNTWVSTKYPASAKKKITSSYR